MANAAFMWDSFLEKAFVRRVNPLSYIRTVRKHKHHQWPTEDVGHPALAQHLCAVIGLMRANNSWKQFKEMPQRAFPKKGETLFLPISEPPK